MVKVKAICRNEKEYVQQTNNEIQRVQRNSSNPTLHPFQGAREYQRALVAAKMEKMFAKPFLHALDEHSDGVSVLAKSHQNLTDTLSGSADGEVILWNLPEKRAQF